ncbi:MAG: hypothetical protein ACYSU0_18760, partial [Planctomycetota bacterium]
EWNNDFNKGQSILNPGNGYFDENMNRVSVTTVQQVNDRAFFKRGGQWVDSRLLDKEKTTKPTRIIKYGTPEYDELAKKLTKEGRQGALSLGKEVRIEVDGEDCVASW